MRVQLLNSIHKASRQLPYCTTAVKSSLVHSKPFIPLCHQTSKHRHHGYTQQYRQISTTFHHRARELLLPGNLVQSPTPDLHLPEDMTLHQLIFDKCDKYHDWPAITDFATGKHYTYKDVKEKVIKVASALRKRGYKKGDVILTISSNQADFTIIQLAASCLGCWFSGANPAYTAEELARQINHGECKAIFVLDVLANVVKEALNKDEYPNQVKEIFVFGESPGMTPFHTLLEDGGDAFQIADINPMEDVCILPYSSGTTGFPKGVMITHYNLVSNLLQVNKHNIINEKENVIGLLPYFHAYAQLVTQFATLYNGGHVHNLTHFEPVSFLKCMQDKQISYANLVPPLILFMAKNPMVDDYDLSPLKRVTSAAAPLGKELTDDFLNKFPTVGVYQGYGMTEASPGTNFDFEMNVGSVGPLLPNTFAKVIDSDSGEVLGANKEGELCVKGPQVMKGYFKNPEATKEMVKEDGWMHTGDVAYYDEKGLFYICDRIKELIKYKAFQVAPAELESYLVGHPELDDACVIGIPNEKAGEVPKAFVVKKANCDITEEDVIKFIEGKVSDAKRLRGGVEFVPEIPKNPSGKILRRLMRNR